jgi:hypothetical protein
MRQLARRLIVYETKGNKSPTVNAADIFSEYEKLRPHLAALMGNGGFQILLSRARVLASAEVSGLRAVEVNTDGILEGLEDLHRQLNTDELFEGRVVLLAQLLELLVAFVGENLTGRLVNEVWPKVPPGDVGLIYEAENGKKGITNEKTK